MPSWFSSEPSFKFDDLPNLTGQVAVITGGSSGIGKATVRELARKQARVFVLGRNPEKTTEAINEVVKETGNPNIEFIQCDLLDLKSVDKAASSFASKGLPVHMLILNGGIASLTGKMELSKDGIEAQY
ncbi:hypothetical protein HDU93_000674, partial [Gonapodya sp. JEL0774]